jgi:hypothetical protein
MVDVLDRIVDALDHVWADGRKPARLLLGHRDAAEVEAALYRQARVEYGLWDDEVLFRDPEYAPKLPYPLTEPCTIFGVPVERVDQPDLLGVIAEGA